MRVGVDFDNTLAGYDRLFADLAVHAGLLPQAPAGGKRAVRDALRDRPSGEAAWRRLQALAYGRHMAEAELIDGVAAFLGFCRERGHEIFIVSHKTRFAAADPDGVDLREAALAWMRAHGFFDAGGFAIPETSVFFEDTRDAKVRRIAALGCGCFVDDLEEVLRHPSFPAGIRRVLFAPDGAPDEPGPFQSCRSWAEVGHVLFG